MAGLLILAAAACGDDDKTADTTVPAETQPPETDPPETTPPETDAPTTTVDTFDEAAAAAEVEANVVGLFDQLAIAGDPTADPIEIAAATGNAAGLIQGGDCPPTLGQVPVIAGLAAAAELTLIIDEAPVFNDEGTEATYVFSALSFGAPSQLDHANGVSRLENGVWKLGAEIWGAFLGMGGIDAPDPDAPFDPAVAGPEVEANVIGLFDQLAIAGAEGQDPRVAENALRAAACLIEGGDTEEVFQHIATIAGLAAAAELTLVIDEAPTFNADGTEATYVFSALSFGAPSQLDHASGVSVLENGVWKISAEIWGAFLAMGGIDA